MSLYVKVRPVSGEEDTKVTQSMYCIYHTRLSPLHQIFLLRSCIQAYLPHQQCSHVFMTIH